MRFLAWYGDHASQLSVVRRFGSIKFFYQYVRSTGTRDDNPADPIKLKQPTVPPQPPFSIEELRRLVSAATLLRDRVLVLIFIGSGCRLGEVAGMDVDDISFEDGLVLVRGKGHRHRYVAPGKVTLRQLRRYIHGRTGAVWLSTKGARLTPMGIYFLLQRLGKRAGVEHVHPHRFRTSFACLFDARTSGDIQSLQLLMGHAKVDSTIHYASWNAVSRALAQAQRLSLADRL